VHGDDEPRIARIKDARDGATPSGNAVQVMNLLRLSAILRDHALRDWADQALSCFAADVLQFPAAGARFMAAAEFALAGPVEVTLVGNRSAPEAQELRREIHGRYTPNRVLLYSNPAAPESNFATPALGFQTPVDGRAAVYICRAQTCFPPATTAAELAERLNR